MLPSEQIAPELRVKSTPLSVRQAVDFAWFTFKKKYRLLSTALLTIFAAWVCLEIVVILGQRLGILVWAVAHAGFLLFFACIEAGFLEVCLRIYAGSEVRFADFFAPWPLALKFLAAQILFTLMVLVGLVLLVFPGTYLGGRYGFFGFCMVSGQSELSESFRQSAVLTTGNRSKMSAIFAGLVLFNILGASLLGVGVFITIPVSALVMTAIFRQLRPSG